MNQPTSKVIQIQSSVSQAQHRDTCYFTVALCEDGSIWEYKDEEWQCILKPIK